MKYTASWLEVVNDPADDGAGLVFSDQRIERFVREIGGQHHAHTCGPCVSG
jgi:hypothetical protein